MTEGGGDVVGAAGGHGGFLKFECSCIFMSACINCKSEDVEMLPIHLYIYERDSKILEDLLKRSGLLSFF